MRVKKRHLRLPDRRSEDPDEKAYAASYDKMTDASPPNAGLVLPKMRAVVLMFSDPRFADKWLVTLTPPKGGTPATKTIARDPDTGLVAAVPIGTEKDFPAGLYKVEVRLEDASNAAAAAAAGGKTSYTLHEMIYFRITNVIGDLDVVCCDPISVEEAVMAQFPVLYEHRTKAAARRAFHPDTEVEARSFPPALSRRRRVDHEGGDGPRSADPSPGARSLRCQPSLSVRPPFPPWPPPLAAPRP